MPRHPRSTWAGGIVAILASIFCVSLFLFFRAAFAGSIVVSPVAFQIGGSAIRWYGLLAALGLALGFPWTLIRAARFGLKPQSTVEQVLWWAVAGGLIGARLLYVVQNGSLYGQHPLQILAVADGGLSIHGMLLGGLLTTAIVGRMLRIDFWRLADAGSPALLLGMILGRFGNFTNGELFGYPTALPWKMFVQPINRPAAYLGDVFFHPIFLYDALLNTTLLIVILRTEKSCRFAGEILWRFLLSISITRFIVEWWRINDPPSVGVLSTAQLVSITLGALSFLVLVYGRRSSVVNRI